MVSVRGGGITAPPGLSAVVSLVPSVVGERSVVETAVVVAGSVCPEGTRWVQWGLLPAGCHLWSSLPSLLMGGYFPSQRVRSGGRVIGFSLFL